LALSDCLDHFELMLSHASLRFAIRNLTFTKNAPVNEVERKFLSDELEMENAADIEFQRAHRIKKRRREKLDR